MDSVNNNYIIPDTWDLDSDIKLQINSVFKKASVKEVASCFKCLKKAFEEKPDVIKESVNLLKNDLSIDKIHEISINILVVKDLDNSGREKFLLDVINLIPREEKTPEVIETIKALLNREVSDDQKKNFLKIFHRIDSDERVGSIINLVSSIESNTNFLFIISALFFSVFIPFEERTETIFKYLLSLVQEDHDEFLEDFPSILRQTDIKQRAKMVAEIGEYLEGKEGVSTKKKQMFFRFASLIPVRTTNILNYIFNSLDTNPHFNLSLFDALSFIEPSKREKILLDLMPVVLSEIEWYFYLYEFLGDEETRLLSYKYLKEKLSSISNLFEASKLAQTIIKQKNVLRISSDEHPLIQQAFYTIGLVRLCNQPQNPYYLYYTLKELSKKPVEFSPPFYSVFGREVSINRKEIQDRLSTHKITFKQLPKDVTPDSLKKLFSRLKSLKEDQKEAVNQYVKKILSFDLDELKEQFVDSYLLNHALATQKNDAVVSQYIAQFFAIIHFIQSLPNTLEQGQLLSKREETFLQIASSIQLCKEGKLEGISLVYKTLPEKYKLYDKDLEESVETARGTRFIRLLVQDLLVGMFSGSNELMRELTQKDALEQKPHQTLFLKNLIGKEVGLPHEVVFDQYTHLIDTQLLNTEKEQAVKAFYKYFTPELLVTSLCKKVKEAMEESTLYNDLENLLREKVKDYQPHQGWEEVEGEYSLKKEVALNLLVSLGYLKEKSL